MPLVSLVSIVRSIFLISVPILIPVLQAKNLADLHLIHSRPPYFSILLLQVWA
ncbi:hypothetical protein DL93DRAFT_2088869 [Clavulina sp. PMI_390]|nr:hypothetical protein DL93DRAFT_2088869 [Clavulina sp. PMI_390]